VSYTFPEYTGLRPKTEIDSGDIWAPEGTTVKITAVADKRLKKATVILGEGQELRTAITADTLVSASFVVSADTYYKVSITDTDGLSNDPPSEYFVHALPDQAPLLTIEKPGRDVKATMVEEVPVQIQVEDDYGLTSLNLHYTVNGDDEHVVSLPVRKSAEGDGIGALQKLAASHLFYLEDFTVQPGDFITYYLQANDVTTAKNKAPVTSEIQFIEIRPFEQEFFRPLSQDGMGGAGGAGGRLSQVQKDIIVATWKLINRKDKLSETEFLDNANVLFESQSNLLEVAQSTLLQMQQRSLLAGESAGKVEKLYSEAIKHMRAAMKALEGNDLKAAATPERESYQNLLRAEAEITEVQLQQSQAGGAGDAASLEELSELFDEEMDKLKNKYETMREAQQQQSEQEVNEALEKVKELARRQEQHNQRMKDLARNEMSEQERKRQIEELRRQQEELRRETQELGRQMQSLQRQNASIPREVQDSLRRTESEMNNSSNNLRQQNAEQAAATGQRALNSLKRLENSLQRNQKESLRRKFDELDQQMQELTDAQKKLTEDVENLSRSGENLEHQLQQTQQDQESLREDLASARKQIESLTEKAQDARNQGSRDMRKFSQDFERSNLEKKMESAQKLLEEKQLNSAAQAERDIQSMLERMQKNFTQLRGGLAESEEEKLDFALDQTRKVREDLERMEREAQELSRANENAESGKQMPGQEGQQNVEAGPGESQGAPQKLDPNKVDWLNNGLSGTLKDLEMMRQSMPVDTSFSRQLQQINRNLQGVVRNFIGGDPNRLSEIEAQVLNPLRTLEAELAQKLELLTNKEKLFLTRDEKIPAEYEELVKKYYESLSKTK
jgi:myosin heavy subunit